MTHIPCLTYTKEITKFPLSQNLIETMGRLTPKAETSLTEDPKSTIKYFRPPHNWCFSDVHSLTFLYYFLSTLAPIGAIPENCAVPSPYRSKSRCLLNPYGDTISYY